MTIKIDGELEIDMKRGVIYFHSKETGHSSLRICCIPKALMIDPREFGNMIDITMPVIVTKETISGPLYKSYDPA